MLAYKLRYDEDNKRFTAISFEVSNEYDFSNDPITNFVEWDHMHICGFQRAADAAEHLNNDIMLGKFELKQCKDCHRYFIITKSEIEWFNERGLVAPKRCTNCRAKNKKEKKENERLESTHN